MSEYKIDHEARSAVWDSMVTDRLPFVEKQVVLFSIVRGGLPAVRVIADDLSTPRRRVSLIRIERAIRLTERYREMYAELSAANAGQSVESKASA